MLIPSAAIALVWALRSQGQPDKAILAVLKRPLPTPPYRPSRFTAMETEPVYGWFHARRIR